MKDYNHAWLSLGWCLFRPYVAVNVLLNMQAFFFLLLLSSPTPSDAFTVAYHRTAIVCIMRVCDCVKVYVRLSLSLWARETENRAQRDQRALQIFTKYQCQRRFYGSGLVSTMPFGNLHFRMVCGRFVSVFMVFMSKRAMAAKPNRYIVTEEMAH